MPVAIDLVGRSFGGWTVLELAERNGSHSRLWRCRCACGSTFAVRQEHLLYGRSTRCKSCVQALSAQVQHARSRARRGLADGFSRTPEYFAVKEAKYRCRKSSHASYPGYDGRGIEYRLPDNPGDALLAVLAEIGSRPSPDHSLDRIDNDGHYELGNLRWATRSEQQRNTRRGSARCQAGAS